MEIQHVKKEKKKMLVCHMYSALQTPKAWTDFYKIKICEPYLGLETIFRFFETQNCGVAANNEKTENYGFIKIC